MSSNLLQISNQLRDLILKEIGQLESSVFCTHLSYQNGVGKLRIRLGAKKLDLSKILGDIEKEEAILKEAQDLIEHFKKIPMSAFK